MKYRDYVKQEIAVIKDRDPAIKSDKEVYLSPSFKAILKYRKAHKLYLKGEYYKARKISQKTARQTGIEIHPGAQIGEGLFIDHGHGVVIGETAIIGNNVTLYQGVTLGGTGKEQGKRHPTLGNNIMVGAGAKILGSVTIGDNRKIGAGSVVLKDVPANSTVVGVPGRVVIQDSVRLFDDLDQIHLPDPVMQDIEIYNTLSRRKEEFKPLEEGKVKMYVCGPTVYNLIHIGNARPMIVFDTVRRYLEYKGYDVNYVSNFTDVDDKIIKKANEEGVSAEEISTRYIAECKKDMEGMNIKPATTHPLATQEIGGMIDMIQTLIDKGYAYEVNGTVYYRTRKFAEYGKLSKKNIDDLEAGHRDEAHSLKVTGEDEKEDPLDFVLWKPKKEGEPSWPSPWSDGRPGWHIECSVMSKKYLADEIDIHAGGEDLIFPHHENEIAQSEAANGVPFSKYWMHNAFLNIDNKKMSKSLGNFFTVRDISREYDLEVLRFFMLSAHYRNPVNFSHDLMESAKNGLDRILTAVDNLRHLSENAKDVPMTEDEKKIIASIDDIYKKFEDSMDDDFNTADAISAIFELVKLANSNSSSDNSKEYIDTLMKKITTLTDILGLKTDKKEEMLDEDIEALIAERQQARKDKNFARADEIRDELLAKGIVLKDTREGVRWSRA